MKPNKLRIEGMVVVIVALAYCALAFYSLITWQAVSEGSCAVLRKFGHVLRLCNKRKVPIIFYNFCV